MAQTLSVSLDAFKCQRLRRTAGVAVEGRENPHPAGYLEQ
jgi:hypothetical protein